MQCLLLTMLLGGPTGRTSGSSMDSMPPLSWSSFVHAWRLAPGWLFATVLLVLGYATCWVLARSARRCKGARGNPVAAWRAGSFTCGCLLLWAGVASGTGAYAMSVFWMHMVLHLMLIMVVPALLVLGHPITVLLGALPEDRRPAAEAVLRSRPVTLATQPLVGLALYTVVIIGTHLTGFMDQMTLHPWLMPAEELLYVVTGYLFLLPLLGEEPIGANPPYLVRMLLLLVAMVPDTLVGIVLLQTDDDPFPVMMSRHPAWAPPPLQDIHIAGGLMWAGGDGLMMTLAIGLMLAVITSPRRRDQMTGPWLESARRATLAERAGTAPGLDPDSDAARHAYNQMLSRLHARS